MLATYSPADLYGDWCSYGWACGAYTIPEGSTEIPAAATDGACSADDDGDDSISGSDPTSGPPAECRDREADDGEGPEGPWQAG